MNSLRVCRLCLEIREDFVNIFEDFEDTTIASILSQHFWFQIYKNDGFSDCLCQSCWTSTKNFHYFYKKVQLLQNNYRKPMDLIEKQNTENKGIVCEKIIAEQSVRLIKQESCVSPKEIVETDMFIVKYEAEESSLEDQVADMQVSNQECPDYFDSNYHQDDSTDECVQALFVEEQSRRKKRKCYDIVDYNKESESKKLTPDSVCEKSNKIMDDLDKSTKSLDLNTPRRSKRDIAKEDAQIREFFSMECEICSDKFETFARAKNHYRIVHNTVGYLTCCGKKFFRRGPVLDHIHRHLNPDAYRCDRCNKRFSDKFALKKHIENHQPLNSRQFKCNLCSSSFTKPSKLAEHERLRHCSNDDKKFRCDKCNKNFVSKSVLASHIRGVHEFAFAHVCDICARVFKSKHVFQNHLQEHSTIIRPKLQCNICGAWLKHEDSLRKHIKRHQDTFANCPICNKVLQNKHSLGNHIRSVHGERSHQCTMCDKAFKKAIVLKEHMALHTGQDLYKCPYCTKTFKSGANMHAHRKKAHFSEWTRDRSTRFTPAPVE